MVVAMVIISIPLLMTTVVSNRQASTFAEIENIINTYWQPTEAQVGNLVISRDRRQLTASFEIYDFTGDIDTNDLIALQQEVQQAVGEDITLQSIIVVSQLDVVNGSTLPLPTPTATPHAQSTQEPALTGTPIP